MKKLILCLLLIGLLLMVQPTYTQQSCIGIADPDIGFMEFSIMGNVMESGSMVRLDTNASYYDLINVVCGNNILSACNNLSFSQTVVFSGIILPQECAINITQKVRFRATSISYVN